MLVNCLSLRRPKTTVELPPRRDNQVDLEFNQREWEDYQRVKAKTLSNLKTASLENRGAAFFNALKWVNELRLICIHGMATPKETHKLREKPPAWNLQEAQARFNQLDLVGLAKCSNANCCQDLSSALSSETGAEHEDEPWIGESMEVWCSLCFKGHGKTAFKFFKICNHLPRRLHQKDSCDEDGKTSLGTASAGPSSLVAPKKDEILPTKLRRLLQDLVETPEDIKRSVTISMHSKLAEVPNIASSSPPGPKRSTLSSPSSGRVPSVASASTAAFPPIAVLTSFAFFAPNLASESSLPPSHAAASGLT